MIYYFLILSWILVGWRAAFQSKRGRKVFSPFSEIVTERRTDEGAWERQHRTHEGQYIPQRSSPASERTGINNSFFTPLGQKAMQVVMYNHYMPIVS